MTFRTRKPVTLPDALTRQQVMDLCRKHYNRDVVDFYRDVQQAVRAFDSASPRRYREVGVWALDGSKFTTYRDERLDGRPMYVLEDGVAAPDGEVEQLHRFLDAAAGEGFVLDGVDAADLYQKIFPDRFAAVATVLKPAAPTTSESRALVGCAAGKDGECGHPDCPQIRDGEPVKSGRHCPLDDGFIYEVPRQGKWVRVSKEEFDSAPGNRRRTADDGR